MEEQNAGGTRAITKIIEETVVEFLNDQSAVPPCKSAYDINNGLCEDFATAVIDKMGGYEKCDITEGWFDYLLTEDGIYDEKQLADWGYILPDGVTVEALNQVWLSHCFIVYDGKYHDAECPEGVDSPFALPLVINALKNKGLYLQNDVPR